MYIDCLSKCLTVSLIFNSTDHDLYYITYNNGLMKSCPLKTTVILMFYSNTMGVACGAGTTNLSRAPKFFSGVRVLLGP